MKRVSPEAKVGLLVLAGLLILVYMSFKVGGMGFGPGEGYEVHLELDNAVGLTKDGEVLVAGIPVGRVSKIELADGRALLTLTLREDVKLPADSVAALRTQGVLGEKYVEIQPGTSARPLEQGDTIRAGTPPGDLDRLVTNLNAIATDVKHVTERLANVLGTAQGEQDLQDLITGLRDAATGLKEVVAENREALRDSLANIRSVSSDLATLIGENRENIDESLANARSFSKTLADRSPAIADNLESLTADLGAVVAENRENLRTSLENLRRSSAALTDTLASVDRLVTSAQSPSGTLGRLLQDDSLYEELQGTLGDLRVVLGRLERGEGTLGKLLTDDTAYAELTQSLENLRSISDKVNRGQGTIGKLVNEESVHDNLNQTLEGIGEYVAGANRFQFEIGYRGEYLTDLGDTKSYFDLTIRPRQDRFYYFALVDDPRGDTDTKTTETKITGEDGTTQTVTEEETVTKDKFKFSAQIGKQFSFLTLRAGLFESSGGVGVDADFWSDRLRLTFEAFDFSRDEGSAHLKLAAQWRFLKHFYVTAGVDDFIDTEGREDVFVGGGVRFRDEDLKFLLSPAASAL